MAKTKLSARGESLIMKKFKFLLIDDNPDDRNLVIRELSRVFPDAEIYQAMNSETFENELKKRDYNLVITDYQLRWSNGIEILKKIKSFNQFIPVIMFTGTGNEEVAVSAMKLGLDDYVIKSPKHFKRLPFSIKLALDNVEQKIKKIQAEQNYKKLFDNVPAGIICLSPKWFIMEINPFAMQMLGLSSEDKNTNVNFKQFFTNEVEFNKFISYLNDNGEIKNFETQLNRKDGKTIWVKIDAKYLQENNKTKYIEAMLKDITLEKMLQSQLIQSQKLEAIGLLAAGIAHDFNNILTPIMGYADMMLLAPDTDPTSKSYLKEISKLAENAANLTKQLLIFSKRKIVYEELISPNQIIQDMVKMLQRIVGEDIAITVELEPNLHIIKMDKSHLQQIIMNLVINARDAMPKGGNLLIKTKNINLQKPSFTNLPKGKKKGVYIVIRVQDSGTGMNEETMKYIFDYFFTTKTEEKRAGLGLSIIYNIVNQYNGFITVQSEENKGTCFDIYFPAYEETLVAKQEKEIQKIDYEKLTGNNQNIFILEDENEVRYFMKTILIKYNYRVIDISTYKEALAFFKQFKEKIDVLLCDLKLPDNNGIDAAKELLSIQPQMKVIISSGYIDKEKELKEIKEQGWFFLTKPYTSAMLLQTIKDILSAI